MGSFHNWSCSWFIVGIFFAFVNSVQGQNRNLHFVIIDGKSQHPVSDAHCFIANSTFGSHSDPDGNVYMEFPVNVNKTLVISHLSYATKYIPFEVYAAFSYPDTLFIDSRSVSIGEITVVEKRHKKWKKYFSWFSKALLGEDKAASQCEIMNPEVLRFHEENGDFRTTAIDLIRVRNKYLKYDIDFLLDELVIEKNGSITYGGRARFYDTEKEQTDKKIQERRIDSYIKGSKFFFKSLIDDRLKEDGFQIYLVQYVRDQFKVLDIPDAGDLVQMDSLSGYYKLMFQEYLQVVNKNIKITANSGSNLIGQGLESHRFNNLRDGNSSIRIEHARSYLYKISEYILLDSEGNVLNPEHLKEYGYWADLRLANQLPFDYSSAEK